MQIYIRSTANISPQHSLDIDRFFTSRVKTSNNFFKSLEPDYDQFVDSKMIRRMSRIVKMGVAAASVCLRNAGIAQPASILTATAYGCLEDSSTFLRRMIEFDEKMLSPTAFIQSTHNTVGAQIALLLRCNNYNNTIVHNAFSFENAIIESQLLIQNSQGPVLVGAIDEITDDRQTILNRFGIYKKNGKSEGNIAGEGAAFFLMDSVPGENPLALIKGVQTLYKPENNEVLQQAILEFLQANNLGINQVDLVLTAHNNNKKQDTEDDELLKTIFQNNHCFPYKSLCGDYPTASGFALWFGAQLLKVQKPPVWMEGYRFPLKNILIHNHSGNDHHSFLLISAC
jgi:3-oxoacyl-[acyl-carrier-protein] synthase II